MKIKYAFFIFIILICSSCNKAMTPLQSDQNLLDNIIKQTANLDIGERKDLNIDIEYESIVVVEPYSTRQILAKLDIDKNSINQILKTMTKDENYQLFIINKGTVTNFVILPSNLSTENDKSISINSPAKLKIEITTDNNRPYKLFK
ncbi:hypothetical protein [Paenibacillus alba]|uniref:Uncharacterized protein n=1 Tax=Paenibacillus alba TaxID=1197127 RepID=A0ABU6FWB4_9BACL|nr:hypothetical protein [Paenibacillus alba]MEC0226035.1 hypothetical protein [Paenibacillus alba]